MNENTKPDPGDIVRIKRGYPGEGFRFTCDKVVGDQVYGHTIASSPYGPVRVREVEVVKKAAEMRTCNDPVWLALSDRQRNAVLAIATGQEVAS